MIGNLWPRKLGSYCIAIIVVLGVAGSNVLIGQQADSGDTTRADLQARITLRVKNLPLKTVIARIAQQARLTPMYGNAVAKSEVNVSLDVENLPVLQAFKQALKGTGLRASINGNHVLIERVSAVDSVPVASGTITGSVLDSATRKGVSGVSVTVMGTALSAVTGEQGDFRIADVPAGQHALSAKVLGYQTRTIQNLVDSGRATAVVILLRQTTTTLSEVVTTATGQQRRVEIANDIARVDAEAIMQRTPVRSMTDLLAAAQVPGVLVTPSSGDPGAPARIRIRGIGSISQSNDPVVIVDGVWIDATGGRPSRLDDIDPSTIETLEIVRGPSAATLYGQDASNGVIIIKTKRGQAGPTRWMTLFNRDWGEIPGRKPVEYVGIGRKLNSSMRMNCNISDVLEYKCIQDSIAIRDPNHPLILNEGRTQTDRYTISVDGGTTAVRYALNGTMQNQLGARRIPLGDLVRMHLLNYDVNRAFLKPSRLTRRNFTANFTMSPNRSLDLMLVMMGNQNDLRDNTYINQYGSVPVSMLNLDTVEFLNEESFIGEMSTLDKSFSGMMSVQAAWRPIMWLNMNAQTGLERISSEASNAQFGSRCIDRVCLESPGSRSEIQNNQNVYTVRLQSSARPSLGWLDRVVEVRPAFGADFRKNVQAGVTVRGSGIPPGERTLMGGTLLDASYTSDAVATAGWYLNATIGILRRLYFDLGIRQDIGSAITSTSNANYPKIGSSWLISDEPFWPQNDLVRTLRFRGAFGHAAVQPNVGDIRGKYVTSQAYIGNKIVPSAYFVSVGNPRLEPERATEFEFGFDTDLLYDRIQLTVTGVHKENRNTLIQRAIAPSAGVMNSSRKENVARVVNQGLELSMTARAIEHHDLLLVLNYNLSLIDNQVARLGNGVSPFSAAGTGPNRIVAGYPIGGVWSHPILGYRDDNEDGLLSREEVILGDSLVYIGWPQPRRRVNYGVNMTLWNAVTVDSRFSYQGRYVQTQGKYNGEGTANIHAPLEEQAIAMISQLSRGRPISDVRWSSASVTYQLPVSVIRRVRARALSISLQGSNLGLWTTYRGRDPAVNTSSYAEGLSDNGDVLPQPRQYVLTIRWGF